MNPPASTALPAPAPAPDSRRLGLLTAAVAAVHAGFILGLPRLIEPQEQGLRVDALLTRMIAPPAPPEAVAAAPVPAPPPAPRPPAPPPKPRPKPPAPKPPAPKPVAEARAMVATPAAPPEPVAEPTPPEPETQVAQAEPAPAPPAPAPQPAAASAGTDREASLLKPSPFSVGGGGGPAPVAAIVPTPGAVTDPQMYGADSKPAQVPPAARLRYNVAGTVKGISYNARAELLWRQDGVNYEADWKLDGPLGITRGQNSAGRVTVRGLEPMRFADKGRSEVAAHFDRANRRVTFSANTPAAEYQAGAQDRLTVALQLGALVAAAPDQYPPGTEITLQIVGPRAAEPWVFRVEGDEVLKVPGAEIDTVRLVRLPRREFDSKIEIWLGKRYAYLPARMRLTQDNGDVADQMLSGAEAITVPRAQ